MLLQAQAEQLKAQLEAARKVKAAQPAVPAKRPASDTTEHQEDREILLTVTDRSGMVRPLPEAEFPQSKGKHKRQKKKTVCFDLSDCASCIYRFLRIYESFA